MGQISHILNTISTFYKKKNDSILCSQQLGYRTNPEPDKSNLRHYPIVRNILVLSSCLGLGLKWSVSVRFCNQYPPCISLLPMPPKLCPPCSGHQNNISRRVRIVTLFIAPCLCLASLLGPIPQYRILKHSQLKLVP